MRGHVHSQEFLERIRGLVASGMTSAQVTAAVRMPHNALISLVWKHKLGPWAPRTVDDCPADFVTNWPIMTVEELRDVYGVGHKKLARWAKEHGLKRPKLPARTDVVITKTRTIAFRPKIVGRKPEVARDYTEAGQAAEFLRQFGPVMRCNAAGQYDPKGGHWRRGGGPLSADTVIEIAKAKGWLPMDVAA